MCMDLYSRCLSAAGACMMSLTIACTCIVLARLYGTTYVESTKQCML